MKKILATSLFLTFASAHAGDAYLKCDIEQTILKSGPKEVLELSVSQSIDRKGNAKIQQRVGMVYVTANLQGSTLRLEIDDHNDIRKLKKEINDGESVTLTHADAKGRTVDDRVFHGMKLTCNTIEY